MLLQMYKLEKYQEKDTRREQGRKTEERSKANEWRVNEPRKKKEWAEERGEK